MKNVSMFTNNYYCPYYEPEWTYLIREDQCSDVQCLFVLWSPPLIFGIGRHRCKIILSGKVLGVAFVYVFVRVPILITN